MDVCGCSPASHATNTRGVLWRGVSSHRAISDHCVHQLHGFVSLDEKSVAAIAFTPDVGAGVRHST